MADFSIKATELSGPSAAGSAPIQGVQGPTKEFNGSWLGWVEPAAKLFAATEKGEEEKILAANEQFAKGLNRINQAAVSGEIGPREVDIRRRALWSQVQMENPDVSTAALQKAMHKQFGFAKDASGIDDEINRAKQLREQEDQVVKAGADLGLWSLDFAQKPENRARVLDTMYQYNDQKRKLELADANLKRTQEAVKSGREDVKWEWEKTKREHEQAAITFTNTNLSNYGDVFGTMIGDYAERVRSGEVRGEEALFDLQTKLHKAKAQVISATAGDQNSQTRATQYLDFLLEQAKYVLDPKNVAEFDAARNSHTVSLATASLYNDYPLTKTLAAMNGSMGPNAVSGVAAMDITNNVVRHLASVAATGSTQIVQEGKKEVQKQMYGAIDKTTNDLVSGKSRTPDKDSKQILDNTKAIITGMARVQPGDNIKLTETVNFLSGPSVKYLLDKGQLSADDMAGAAGVYQTFYRDEALRQVHSAMALTFNKPVSPGSANVEAVPIADFVTFTSDANGNVRAVPNWKDQKELGSPAAQWQAYRALNNMNRQLAGLNTAIKIGAHLEGRTDYQKFFEENRELLLPGTKAPEGTEAPSPQSSSKFEQVFAKLIGQESGGKHTDKNGNLTTSNKGAEGITQIMPKTAENPGYGVTPPKDKSVAEYTRVGREYLQAMLKTFDNDYEKALAAYNAGPGNVNKAVRAAAAAGDATKWKDYLPKKSETLPYIENIMAGIN